MFYRIKRTHATESYTNPVARAFRRTSLLKRKAAIHGKQRGFVNVYEMTLSSAPHIMDFSEDLETWIDFVCDCRNGSDEYLKYDIIKGKVANDKVFRVVDMYKRGIWDKVRAIQEIRVYKTYDQIAFISQKAIEI